MTLTDRELDVIDTLTAHPGWKTVRIAHALGITEGRAKNLLASVFAKYDVENRTAAVVEHKKRQAKARRRRSTVAEGQLELA